MKNFFTKQTLAAGLAMFSMFFGAGNIIYPLAVGQYAGDQNIYAMSGLILTAAVMPIAGVIAIILFDGDYKEFFGRLGKVPGFFLALLTISLLGPLGSTPRCITLAYTTIKSSFPDISSVWFSAISCLLIFVLTVRKNHIITILGWILTPLLLGSLATIIIIGFITAVDIQVVDVEPMQMFLHGLKEGYNTMDLLAAFFISSTVIASLKRITQQNPEAAPCYFGIAMKASLMGAALLAVVYVGFSYLAAFHGGALTIHGKDELLAALAMQLVGAHAGMLVCATVSLACLTTAIALTAAFTEFLHIHLFQEKIGYEMTLIGALCATFFMSTFEFTGISAFLWPILQICYPGLIVLTLLNIAYKLFNFTVIKGPVFCAFGLALYFYFT